MTALGNIGIVNIMQNIFVTMGEPNLDQVWVQDSTILRITVALVGNNKVFDIFITIRSKILGFFEILCLDNLS